MAACAGREIRVRPVLINGIIAQMDFAYLGRTITLLAVVKAILDFPVSGV